MANPQTALPYICDLQPYKPGIPIEALAREYGIDPAQIIKLASNENPDGMSPKATETVRSALSDAFRYPDGYELRQALADFYGLSHEQIVLGNGSNDVLDLVARVYLATGTEAISSEHAFIVYRLVTAITGASNVFTPAKAFGHDLEAMLAAITDKTRVIWIANPNNPTGTFIPYLQVQAFLEQVPKHVIVVLDEAYYEYLSDADRLDTTKWLKAHPNLVLTRTFSKAYGLAGLRAGYALAAPQVANLLNRVRQPFNVSNIALAAAVAALGDQDHVQTSREHTKSGLQHLKKGLDALGLDYLPTYGNFVSVAFHEAATVHQTLLKQGVIVRPLTEYNLPHHLRISVGTSAENQKLLTALQKGLDRS